MSGSRSRRVDGTVLAVLAVTALALLLRFVWLGDRVAHQDEARVAYWTLRFAESGVYEYRPIVHGPFLNYTAGLVFELIGPSDFAMRVPTALVGGLFPLAALLFRGRLRDTETVGLAALLAVNPLLVYYSRFMREDVPLAVFVMVALGLFVRYYDTRRTGYLFGGVASLALAFTTKENVLVYLLCWGGALVLLFDHRLFLARVRGQRPGAVARAHLDRVPIDLGGFAARVRGQGPAETVTRTLRGVGRGAWTHRGPIAVATVACLEFFLIFLFFYAPRGGGYFGGGQGGLWISLDALVAGNPGPFVGVVEEAYVGSWQKFVSLWAKSHGNTYTTMLGDLAKTIFTGAAVLFGLALVGFVADRYSDEGPRDLVAAASYWGFVSVLGYPVITDIAAPWAAIHAIVPLAIPAAVGLGVILDWGREALAADDRVGVAAAVLAVLCLTAFTGHALVQTTYLDPVGQDNELVQYAQSSTDMKETLETVRVVARDNEGTDVVWYGDEFYSPNESVNQQAPASPGRWFDRLPMAWYFEIYEYEMERSTGEFVANATKNRNDLRGDAPPVIVTLDEDVTRLRPVLDRTYETHEHQRYLYASEFVIMIEERAAANASAG